MSVPKRSLTGKQPPAKPDPPRNPATDHSLPQVRVERGGPGKSWFNLTRQDVEEKMGKYRQQQAAKNQGALWQRLASVFRKSSKTG